MTKPGLQTLTGERVCLVNPLFKLMTPDHILQSKPLQILYITFCCMNHFLILAHQAFVCSAPIMTQPSLHSVAPATLTFSQYQRGS